MLVITKRMLTQNKTPQSGLWHKKIFLLLSGLFEFKSSVFLLLVYNGPPPAS